MWLAVWKEIEGLEETIDVQVKSLINLRDREYLTTSTEYRPVDLTRITQYFTLDVIMPVDFGKQYGYLETNSDVTITSR